MKLNKLIYGILGIFAFSSCADQMEYHEYKSDGEEFVKLNFGNVGGLVTTIYLDLDTDFGSTISNPSKQRRSTPLTYNFAEFINFVFRIRSVGNL